MTDGIGKNELDEQQQKQVSRICNHMNQDHMVSVYAMIKSMLPSSSKISNYKMASVSLDKVEFSYVECTQGMCAMRQITLPLDPPLESMKELRPRLIQLHRQLLSPPSIVSIFTEPICTFILVFMIILGYISYLMTDENLVLVFPVPVVRRFFLLTQLAHILEGVYGGYLAYSTLKLGMLISLQWLFTISLVGYPMTSKVMEYSNIATAIPNKEE
mmetsp:Transcript_13599/g.20701  ORF Transcript_13599/g.20701 Transcript_13599/m.20701 type:complete len:215 (+) Transcript_13599:109-753(+)|eukprot:CAMPEP_0178938244 /NCGR_PEP_ID=MMETSP0786-20121207/26221_1 /TAXON_ID=186022 /ORGANISM="Thalassionema frauenfeldii, Strain CCMP 1798" /LENGTH=214 /DNA_ID=CAMNT_0020616937 /DNA_START=19 /DNA_END=663 /DNA_ORIENTATION=-